MACRKDYNFYVPKNKYHTVEVIVKDNYFSEKHGSFFSAFFLQNLRQKLHQKLKGLELKNKLYSIEFITAFFEFEEVLKNEQKKYPSADIALYGNLENDEESFYISILT